MADLLNDEELSPRTKALYAPPPLPPPMPSLPEPLEEDEDFKPPVTEANSELVKTELVQEEKNPAAIATPALQKTPTAGSEPAVPTKPATPALSMSEKMAMSAKIASGIIPPLPEFSLLPPESIIPISTRTVSVTSSLPSTAPSSTKSKHLSSASSISPTLPRANTVASVAATANVATANNSSTLLKTEPGAMNSTVGMDDNMSDSAAAEAVVSAGAPANAVENGNSTTTPARPKRVIEPIFYDLGPSPSADAALKARVIQERQKQLVRRLRFSGESPDTEELDKAPITETTVLGARRAAIRRGFATGFDTTSPEEKLKRLARYERFGAPETHPFYKPDDDLDARMARAERFGPDAIAAATESNQKTMPRARTLETRRTPDESETPRMTTIHLFGVDNLSTTDVVSYFTSYGPSWCEWLNDSSCNIEFEDTYTMRRALKGLSVGANESQLDLMEQDTEMNAGKQDTDKAEDEQGGEGKSKSEEKEEDDRIGMDIGGDEPPVDDLEWRQVKPWMRKGRTTPMWARMATDKDIRPERPNPKSKWSRTIKRKLLVDGDEDGYTFFTVKKGATRSSFMSRDHRVAKDSHSIQKSSYPRKPSKLDT